MSVRLLLLTANMLLITLIAACANQGRYAGMQVGLEHAVAIDNMLQATRADEIALNSVHLRLKQLAVQDPENSELVKDGLKVVNKDFMIKKMIPVYAKYFTEQQAIEIASFYQRKTGRKYTELVANPDIPAEKYQDYLTYKERSELTSFIESDTGQVMLQAAPRIRRDLVEIGKAIGDELSHP